jgi:hypothetical protein
MGIMGPRPPSIAKGRPNYSDQVGRRAFTSAPPRSRAGAWFAESRRRFDTLKAAKEDFALAVASAEASKS